MAFLFVDGTAFFVFGIAILLQRDMRSRLRFRHGFPLLAAFGLLRGCEDWIAMAARGGWSGPVHRDLLYLSCSLDLVSYLCLVFFDGVFLKLIRYRFALLMTTVLAGVAGAIVLLSQLGLSVAELAAVQSAVRMYAGVPAGLGAGLIFYLRSRSPEMKRLGSKSVVLGMKALGAAFVLHALGEGLGTPPWGANSASPTDFAALVPAGLPAQMLSGCLAVTMCVLMIVVLQMFRLESRLQLKGERSFTPPVLDSLPGGVAILDGAGRLRRWNKNFLGFSPEEASNLGSSGIIDQDSWDVAQQAMLDAIEKGTVECEARLVDKNGGRIPCFLSGSRVEFENVPCVLGVAVDISKLKHAEQYIDLQAAALQSAANSIVITDADGTIQWVNPAFTRLTGYSFEEAVGQNPRVLKSGEHDSDFYQTMWNTIKQGKAWIGELSNRRKDGQIYSEQMAIAPVRSEKGTITNFVAIKQDMTVQKRMESDLVKAKEVAELANRAKSEFLANMSHEIRTPLNGIIGMTELALQADPLPEMKEYLQTIELSANTLLCVINDVLDFSKIEAGRVELDEVDFNLRDYLESALKTLALRADEKGLELLCDISDTVPEHLIGDCVRLRQVVLNLVGNAIKFTHSGEVLLKVRAENLTPDTCTLAVTVADTGIGIPERKFKSIFDPFTQADASTTRNFGGTGLGLTISSRLVSMMGGQIWVESEIGRGSKFHFTVQVRIARSGDLQQSAPTEMLRGIKTLIVDDNPTNRQILVQMLNRWDVDCTTAESATEALAMLDAAQQKGSPYGLLLTDLQMPGMDGLALIEEIRRQPERRRIAVVLLTSAGHYGTQLQRKALGDYSYLFKPVRSAELHSTILNELGRRHVSPLEVEIPRVWTESNLKLDILLTEDNPVNQLVAMRVLAKMGHEVTIATDGHEALAILAKRSFDLILMDVQMPEMDGFETTARIRDLEKEDRIHVPIIAMTAHALKGDRERCLDAGMDEYVSKPISRKELESAISSAIKSKEHRKIN